MFSVRNFLAKKGSRRLAVASCVVILMALWGLANSAEPRIDYIIKTNVNKVEIHFGTEANRTYVLEAINSLPCTNCNGSGAGATNWTTLLTVPAASFPPSNHY